MKLHAFAARPSRSSNGFTLIEYVITIMLTVLAVGALMILSEGTGKALVGVTTQTSDNQSVGNGVELMISRIRMANTASNDATCSTLQLSFDDDPDVDSDGDGTTWNDKDHYELFIFKSGDTNLATLDDNYIAYATNKNSGTTNIIIPSYVRQLSGLPVFSVSNNNTTVWINFGLLTTNATPLSQAIEIRTKAVIRNKTS